jgi:hypothetical protein
MMEWRRTVTAGKTTCREISRRLGVPAWIEGLGITDRLTGLERARAAWDALITAGRSVAETDLFRVEHLVFMGFLARVQGFHASYTLLHAYSENVAAILYVKDHPAELDKFWRHTRGSGVSVDKIIDHALSRFRGFKGIYSELSKYAHSHALSLLASSQVVESGRLRWSSVPIFKSDHDAMMACVWTVELAEATSHLLTEFAAHFDLSNKFQD